MKLNNNYNLTILSFDEIKDLKEQISILSERQLQPTWAYIQSLKYNGMIQEGDCVQPNLIFTHCELPLIKRLYPPEYVNPKVKQIVTYILARAKKNSQIKFQEYLELRRSGIPIERARKEIAPIYTKEFLEKIQKEYSRSFKYKYAINCRDADLIYNMGIDSFIKLFYDRFYQPVTK